MTKIFACLQNPMQSFLDVNASHLLNELSGLTGDDKLKKSELVYPAVGKGGRLRESFNSWVHLLVCPLYILLRRMCCHTHALGLGTTSCSILCTT